MFEPIEPLALKKLHSMQLIKRYELLWLFNNDALYITVISSYDISEVFVALDM